MKYDFLVNTDARSTLICAPWEVLVNREPFTRHKTAFSLNLENSLRTPISQQLETLKQAVKTLRAQLPSPELIPVHEISDWSLDNYGLHPKNLGSFDVIQIEVHVEGREIAAWDQPIISSVNEGYVELVCGQINGVLHFLFVLQIEPGLYNLAELGPSLIVTPGSASAEQTYASHPESTILLECKQSDEGGRFFQDVSTYRLIDTGEAFSPPTHGYWLTLAQTRQLLNEGGWFTNEARSALSLLLNWL
jgi:oxidase EvaA